MLTYAGGWLQWKGLVTTFFGADENCVHIETM